MKKSIKIIIIALIAISVLFVLVAAANAVNRQQHREPLVVDTNTRTIKIKETIKQGDVTFTIKKLEIGDNYSTIYYEMSPFIEGEMLKGAQLFRGDEPIAILATPCSMHSGCAICFEPVSSTKNLSLHIAKVYDVTTFEEKYELHFENDEANILINTGDKQGELSISLEGVGISATLKGLDDLSSDKFTTRTGVPTIMELFIGDTGEENLPPLNKSNPPTHVKITYRLYTFEETPLIIPIS